MAAREKGGRVVFIGNIPYGVSEEQICDIFGRIGKVVSFRLVYDKETGKPKGFGFLEYPDVDQAAAAVRNLNGHDVMGRQLKVDYSNDNSGGSKAQNNDAQSRAPPPAHFDPNSGGLMPNGANPDLPPLPQGVELPPGLTAPDAISKTLSALPPAQLVDVISQMKTLVATDPAKATAVLQQAPQLSFAICQALMLLGLVDQNIIGSLLQQRPSQPQPRQPQQPPMPYQQPAQQQYQPPPYGQSAPPNPYGAPVQQPYQQVQHPGYVPTPPQQQHYQPPPQPTYQQQPAAQDQNQQLIQQVLAMTREQIFAMDEISRNQLIQLRAQLGAPVS